MNHDEYAVEPIPGLPARLPEGESLLWQGAPNWRALAVRAFHIRKVAIYFVVLWLLFAIYQISYGEYGAIAVTALRLVIPAVLGIAVLCALAALYARMTVYTITTHRIVIRSGIALPMSVNVPFAQIESAAAKHHGDGTSDLPVRVARGQNSSYVVLWPNVRPWHFRRPEPMLRALSDGQRAANILASALDDYADPDADATPRIDAQEEKADRRNQSTRNKDAGASADRAIA